MGHAFRLPPTRNPDKGFLEESESVGTPGQPYPGSYTNPNPNQEAPFTSNRQIPYRGASPHGVALTDDESAGNTNVHLQGVMEPYTPGEEGAATQEVAPVEGWSYDHAVPVHVVSTAPELALRKRFTSATFTLNVGDAPKRILNFRPNRTKTLLWIKPLAIGGTTDRVWFSNDEGVAAGAASAFPYDVTDPPFPTNTTDDIWCVIDPAGTHGTMVIVYQEWEIEAQTEKEAHTETDKRHAKHN